MESSEHRKHLRHITAGRLETTLDRSIEFITTHSNNTEHRASRTVEKQTREVAEGSNNTQNVAAEPDRSETRSQTTQAVVEAVKEGAEDFLFGRRISELVEDVVEEGMVEAVRPIAAEVFFSAIVSQRLPNSRPRNARSQVRTLSIRAGSVALR